LGSISRTFQVLCYLVVWVPRGLGQVPGAAVKVELSISGMSKRPVRVPSVSRCCRLIDSRTDQRMAKHYVWRHFQQAIRLDLAVCGLIDSEVLGGAPHKSWIASRLGGRDEQKALGGWWELRYPSLETRFNSTRYRDRRGQAESPGKFGRRQAAGQLEQGKRISTSFREDALKNLLVERIWKGRSQ
jgi:hypothetical protein